MANHLNLTEAALDKYLGKSIESLCPLDFGSIGDEYHHCAHFVGHVLRLNQDANVGFTCAGMTTAGRKRPSEGACLRVNEVFNRTEPLEYADAKGCLIYITMKGNVTKSKDRYVMGTQSKKHIGIYLDGKVWHYGNTKDKVRKQTLAEFGHHYAGATIILYTKFPKKAVFTAFGDRLLFDGRKLAWVRNGRTLRSWPAVSGREGFQTKAFQSLKGKGPLPEGLWEVRQNEYQKMPQRSWLEQLAAELGMTAWPGGESAWGKDRIWLHPRAGTQTYGRSGFSIHGGDSPGSAGCIDLTTSMPEFAREFLACAKDLELDVKY